MLDPNKIAKTLVDRHNLHEVLARLEPLLAKAQLLGFDIETHDALRHQGLNELMKVEGEGGKEGYAVISRTYSVFFLLSFCTYRTYQSKLSIVIKEFQ